MRVQILTRTRGQQDSWQQKQRMARCLVDRKQRQKKTPVDVVQEPNDPLDSLLMMMSWQGGGQKKPSGPSSVNDVGR